jgi:hypothetical protein
VGNSIGWAGRLVVSGDGKNLISHAGAGVLRLLADQTGLTGAFSVALARRGFTPGHDRGRVFTDLATSIADGSTTISGIDVLGQSAELYGQVASVPTAWRCLNEIGDAQITALAKATARTRRHVWNLVQARHGALPPVKLADRQVAGITCVRIDATVCPVHSDKEGAAANFKGFGLHPLLSYCDNTRESLVQMMRPGTAGSNTATDHIKIVDASVTAIPARHRRKMMVTVDGAGTSHDLINHLHALAGKPGRQLWYWVGWDTGTREKTAIGRVPDDAWEVALDPVGKPRTGPGEGGRQEDKAQVVELTWLLRDIDGKGTNALQGWPADLRVFCRRERPHPGAQLSLLEETDGWRYQLWCTNMPRLRPSHPLAWLSKPAYNDVCYRSHARVEDRIRTGKDTGIAKFPSHSYKVNTAWLAAAGTATNLLAWLALLALDGDLAKAEPATIRYRLLHTAARLTRGARNHYLKIDETWPWTGDLVTAFHRIQALPGP